MNNHDDEPLDNDPEPQQKPPPADRLATVEQRLAMVGLRADYGLSAEQATLVYRAMVDHELPEDEALLLARERHPDQFGSAQGPTFGSMRPGSGGGAPIAQDDFAARVDYIQKLRRVDRKSAETYSNNLCGRFMAKALGWDHHLMPIPGIEAPKLKRR